MTVSCVLLQGWYFFLQTYEKCISIELHVVTGIFFRFIYEKSITLSWVVTGDAFFQTYEKCMTASCCVVTWDAFADVWVVYGSELFRCFFTDVWEVSESVLCCYRGCFLRRMRSVRRWSGQSWSRVETFMSVLEWSVSCTVSSLPLAFVLCVVLTGVLGALCDCPLGFLLA